MRSRDPTGLLVICRKAIDDLRELTKYVRSLQPRSEKANTTIGKPLDGLSARNVRAVLSVLWGFVLPASRSCGLVSGGGSKFDVPCCKFCCDLQRLLYFHASRQLDLAMFVTRRGPGIVDRIAI